MFPHTWADGLSSHTGDESKVMLDAHSEAGFVVGTPFSAPGLYDFAKHGKLTQQVFVLPLHHAYIENLTLRLHCTRDTHAQKFFIQRQWERLPISSVAEHTRGFDTYAASMWGHLLFKETWSHGWCHSFTRAFIVSLPTLIQDMHDYSNLQIWVCRSSVWLAVTSKSTASEPAAQTL